jgi:hypothetical protein
LIFLFNGPPGSGKDEACKFCKSKGFTHLSFKTQLFIETAKLFGVDLDWFMSEYESAKEIKVKELNGMSRRQALIYTSEVHIKPIYGLDYFGKKVAEEMYSNTDYCFSDCGFNDEVIPIINKLGADAIILIQLTREGCDFSSDSRRYINGTLIEEFILGKNTPLNELYLLKEHMPIKTYRVHNNSTASDFHAVLQKIHEKEQNARKAYEEKGKSNQSIL